MISPRILSPLRMPFRHIWILAGVAGFEPANDGVKVRCLTTWLYPNDGAGRGTRTLTVARQILSLVRLPIPPYLHNNPILVLELTILI